MGNFTENSNLGKRVLPHGPAAIYFSVVNICIGASLSQATFIIDR